MESHQTDVYTDPESLVSSYTDPPTPGTSTGDTNETTSQSEPETESLSSGISRRHDSDSFEFLNPSPELSSLKHRQPYGPYRDTMGNYIGPDGDSRRTEAHSEVENLSKIESVYSTPTSQTDESRINDSDGPQEYTMEIRQIHAPRHAVAAKRVMNKQINRLRPHVRKGRSKLRTEKNELLLKTKPYLQEAKSIGLKVTHKVKITSEKVGTKLALRGVRFITGRPTAFSQTDLGDEESDPEIIHEDPFDFDLDKLKVQPVLIPKLVISSEPPPRKKGKTHAYFEGLKKSRYDAIIDQAQSKYTKEVAEKLKNNELKPKVPKQVTHSIGPRIHVGFKCDTEKQLLTIRMIEANGLPGKDSNGLSDPYCVVTLKPDAAIDPLRTRIIGKTVNPKWKEVFELSGVPPLSVLARQILHVAVYDYDQIGSDDLVGYVDISLATHDLTGGTDMWFDLRTKENEEQFRVRGHILAGLRYDERHELLTVFLERCHSLERVGWLMLKGALHINGLLVKEEKAKLEHTTSVHPELKRRMVFTKVKKSLLDEYTVSVYMAFRRYFMCYNFFGQVDLSSKSKIKDEETLWSEAVKIPGEAAFKQLSIQPFVGLVKKPWTPAHDEVFHNVGYIHLSLKTSARKFGIILTCTLNKAEEIHAPHFRILTAELYLVKEHVLIAKENTVPKRIGQKITPLEEQFDFRVESEDIEDVELMIVLFHQAGCRKDRIGYVNFSKNHSKSTVEEMEIWQTVMKTHGHAVEKRFRLRPLLPEATLLSLSTTDEINIPLRDPSLLPGKNQLGVLVFSIKYDENKEQLNLFIETVNGLCLPGTYFVEGFLWDLRKNVRRRERSSTTKTDGRLLEFKETLQLKNLHSSFYESHHLCIRVMKKRFMRRSSAVGQVVIKIEKPA